MSLSLAKISSHSILAVTVRPPSLFILFIFAGIGAQAQRQNDSTPLRISLLGEPWAFQMKLPGFVVKEDLTRPDGRKYLYAQNEAAGLGVSIALEKVGGSATLEGCRKVFRGRTQPSERFKMSGKGADAFTSDVERTFAGFADSIGVILEGCSRLQQLQRR